MIMKKADNCQIVIFPIDEFEKMGKLVFACDGLGFPGTIPDGWDVGSGIPCGVDAEKCLPLGLRDDSIWLRKLALDSEGLIRQESYYVLPEWFTRGMWSMIYKRDEDVNRENYLAGYAAAQKEAAARADDMIKVEIPTDPVEEFRAIPWGSQDLGTVTLYAGVDGNPLRWALIGRVVESLRIWEIPEVLGAALTRKLDSQREGAYESGRARGAQEATQRALNTMALGKASESKF